MKAPHEDFWRYRGYAVDFTNNIAIMHICIGCSI